MAQHLWLREPDNSNYWRHDYGFDGPGSFYPSYIDMCDITAGLIPKSTINFIVSLPYCGMSRQEWVNAPFVLLQDASILVGFGLCRYSQPEDFADGVLLGDSHVGDTVLQLIEGSSTDDVVLSCRRWNMKCVPSDGISLFERLQQYEGNGASLGRDTKASREDRQSMYGGKEELLIRIQRLEQNQQMRMSQLEAYIDENFKLVAGGRAAKMETESVLR